MRHAVAIAVTLWLAPVLAAGVHAFALSSVPSVLIGVVLAAVVARLTAPSLTETIAPALRVPAVAVIVAVMAAAAIGQIGRISVYMADPTRMDCSYMANDPFRASHSCMTAYAEAIRLSAEPETNIYEMSLYEPRRIEPLRVDSFHYPPPFLVLPAAVHAIRPDIVQFRSLWFVMQCAVLAAAVFGLARWIGGTPGSYAAAGGVLAFASPQFVYSLQQGNVQSTAMPAAAVGLVWLLRGRLASGSLVLAYFAVAKIFPGVLIVYLAAARRWRAIAVTAACGAAIVGITLLLFGPRPFADFLHHELPRISNGAAFPQSESPNGASANVSVDGQTVRLRVLGTAFLNQRRGLFVASIYGLLVILVAAAAGWRKSADLTDPVGRLRLLQLAVGLLLLASFRSPFVGFYGYVAVIWLFALLAAESRAARPLLSWWGAAAIFALLHAWLPSPAFPVSTIHLVVSSVLFCAVLGLAVFAIARSSVARATRGTGSR